MLIGNSYAAPSRSENWKSSRASGPARAHRRCRSSRDSRRIGIPPLPWLVPLFISSALPFQKPPFGSTASFRRMPRSGGPRRSNCVSGRIVSRSRPSRRPPPVRNQRRMVDRHGCATNAGLGFFNRKAVAASSPGLPRSGYPGLGVPRQPRTPTAFRPYRSAQCAASVVRAGSAAGRPQERSGRAARRESSGPHCLRRGNYHRKVQATCPSCGSSGALGARPPAPRRPPGLPLR
jgi:hypothetical protein